MATITTDTFLDGGVARTAGEAWTINSGGKLTIRTDTRVHANAPAAGAGSLGSVTINEGELVWDSTAVRWMPFDSGTGNVPAIGTTITQGGVSGYLLGVWASIISAQTAVGAEMPSAGFIKFREVTNGPFSTGVLTGIGASATGPDVQGWMELAHDATATFTIPRLGKHTARGGKFFLDDTNGVRGQIFQIPTMGSAAMFAPGLFVETEVADEYEFVPALNGGTCGWGGSHLGEAFGESDGRQKFVRADAGGKMVMGDSYIFGDSTYVSIAAQASTYSQTARACTYTWENNIVHIYTPAGHMLETGQQTGLDFTTGDALAYDGIYSVTILSPYHFTIPLIGSGIGGNVTSRAALQITFTAHTLNIGEYVYCNFTSGTGVSGIYEVDSVANANSYLIKYPTTLGVTSGAVSCLHTLRITTPALHYRNQGQRITCDFISGGATNGNFTIKKVPTTTTIDINFPHSSAIATSSVIVSNEIGYVFPAGRRTWIPSNILTECTTVARALNMAANPTIASRPEWATTSAGALDLEYVYGTSGYLNAAQPYSMRLRNCVFFDGVNISECATPLDIEGLYVGMQSALDVTTVWFGNNYAGGTVKKVNAKRGNGPGTSDHAISITYCKGITFEDIEGGIVQYVRSTGFSINVATSQDCTFIRPKVFNTAFNISGSPNTVIKDIDYCERVSGYGLGIETAVKADANCNNLTVDGITYGLGFTVSDQQPNRLLYAIGCSNVKLRNCGTLNNPMPLPTFAKNANSLAYIFQSGGSNNGVKIQKVFVEGVKTAPFATVNTDKNMLYESIGCGMYSWAAKALLATQYADLNGTIKNCPAIPGITAQASVYGTHFMDTFLGSDFGTFTLMCNEPTAETASVFTSVVGEAKWNSSGGVFISTVGNQHIWETPYYIKGHTGFLRTEMNMTGVGIALFKIHYQIDTGSGYSAWRNGYYRCAGAVGTTGQYTFTVTDASGVEVGDYCWGIGLSTVNANMKAANIPRVESIVGNTITVNRPNVGTVSGDIRLNHLPDEILDPIVGFKMKIRITCTSGNVAAMTFLTANTLSSIEAQDNYYDLDSNTVTFTGLPAGCDAVVLNAGTSTVLDQKDSLSGTSYIFTYSGNQTVDVGFIKAGYTPFYIRALSLTTDNSSIPVSLTPDRNYQ